MGFTAATRRRKDIDGRLGDTGSRHKETFCPVYILRDPQSYLIQGRYLL